LSSLLLTVAIVFSEHFQWYLRANDEIVLMGRTPLSPGFSSSFTINDEPYLLSRVFFPGPWALEREPVFPQVNALQRSR
jgi:hypothetical protein